MEAFNDLRYEIEPATGDKEKFLRVVDGNCESGNRVYRFETGNQTPYL